MARRSEARILPARRPWPLPAGTSGVTLLEVMVASIAGMAVLAGLASIYMTTLTAYETTTRRAHTLSYSGRVEDLLTEIAIVGPNDRRKAFTAPSLGSDGLPLWVAVAYDRLRDYRSRMTRGYPRDDDKVYGQDTGIVFWWRDVWSPGHGRYLVSNLYHFRCEMRGQGTGTNQLNTLYGGARPSFIEFTNGDMAGFVNRSQVRQAAQVLAHEVLGFQIQVTADSLFWEVDYRRSE